MLTLTLSVFLALVPVLYAQNTTKSVVWKTGNARVDALVAALTPDEKLGLVGGGINPGEQNPAGYVGPVPRLGIPAVQLSDGEAGINIVADATAIPVQLNVAATWSREAAFQAGLVTGREARLLNQTVALAPRVNLLRDPLEGNFWQSYSEDPLLNAQLGIQGVNGIQSQGTMANAKQIGPSSTGASSGDVNSIVDLQTLYEVYWAPYGELLDAGAATLMCSYAQVNGIPACQHPEIFEFVREVHNFTGTMMSDWTATHSTGPSIEAGLDWEMPFSEYFGQPLNESIYIYGNLSETYLDRAVGHILLKYDEFGLLDSQSTSAILTTQGLPKKVEEESAAIAYDIAVKSGALLKNEGVLPLNKNASIAVIGPNGVQYTNGAAFAERAWGFPERRISVHEALERRLNTTVPSTVGVDLEGTVIPSSALISLNGTAGLSRNDSLRGRSVDSTVDFSGTSALPGNRTYMWQGQLIANESGLYRISLARNLPSVSGSARNNIFAIGSLYINGSEIAAGYRLFLDGGIHGWSSPITTRDGWDNIAQSVYLEAGVHDISATLGITTEAAVEARLSWVTPSAREAELRAAEALARAVDTPIVFAFAQSPASVGMTLEAHLDDLVSRVAAANPNTVVVLNNAEPVLMPWLPSVSAVLGMGYPGQEQGYATTDLLFGTRNPQGRFPVTYPTSINSSVTRNPAHSERVDTDSGNATFSEAVNIAYRWYTATNTSVLFPLGYGLSYTTFEYSDLDIRNNDDGVTFAVSFTLRNTGDVFGAEVPQVYVLPTNTTAVAGAKVAAIQLVGFDNVELEPKGVRKVVIEVPRRKLEVFDVENREWKVLRGGREVWVARNAGGAELRGSVVV